MDSVRVSQSRGLTVWCVLYVRVQPLNVDEFLRALRCAANSLEALREAFGDGFDSAPGNDDDLEQMILAAQAAPLSLADTPVLPREAQLGCSGSRTPGVPLPERCPQNHVAPPWIA